MFYVIITVFVIFIAFCILGGVVAGNAEVEQYKVNKRINDRYK